MRAAGLFGDALTGVMARGGHEATQQAAEATSASAHSSTHTLTGGWWPIGLHRSRPRQGRSTGHGWRLAPWWIVSDVGREDSPYRGGGEMHVLRLSMEMLGSRCVSASVPATVEPNFAEFHVSAAR